MSTTCYRDAPIKDILAATKGITLSSQPKSGDKSPHSIIWRNAPGSGRGLPIDKVLLATVLGLTLFGIVMVYSASAIQARKNFDSQFYFLGRQGLWAVLGFAAMAFSMRMDYRHYKRPEVVVPFLIVTFALLLAVFFFPEINGANRWIRYGGYFSLQPSEVAKLAMVFFLSFFFERSARDLSSIRQTLLPAAGVAGAMIVLVAAEPDLGTAMAMGLVFVVMAFQVGVPVRRLALLALPAAPVLAGMLLFVPWRFQRLLAFLDPWANQKTSGYQVVQSLIAIGSGGLDGLGFAEGKQKLFYLPSPHADFIFAVIGEELGLIGAATVVLLFTVLALRGLRAARFAPDTFGQLLAVGLTAMITIQAFFNISVTLSLVPTKGIPLPFISHGGSSLAISLFATGVLLNISKHART
ncbi:MAG: putative lipid II flippase FtsW [Blastocatellia bacterium]|nr:putative lipid II flippase FtsW [Blastocatellia bacterium]